jgi:hypothetical protein
MNSISQVVSDPLLNGLTQAGVLGVIIAILFWRDVKKDEKLEKIVDALNHLTRALTIEVLSRPDAMKRAQDEAREIQAVIDRK